MGERSSRDYRKLSIFVLVLLLGVAGLLRLISLCSALPYIGYVDEGHVLHPVMRMLASGGWDPGWYRYPTLLINLIVACAMSVDVFLPLLGKVPVSDRVPIGHEDFYDIIGPPGLILLGRVIVLLHSVGIIALCYLIGCRLLNRWAGVFAATISAFLPGLVDRASIVNVDTVATFYVLLTLYFALIFLKESSIRYVYGAGCFAGLAFAAKYQSGAVFLALITSIFVVQGNSFKKRAHHSVAGLLGLMLGMFVGMPALVFRFGKVLKDIQAQWAIYTTKTSASGYITSMVRSEEVGSIVLVAAGLGFCTLFLSGRTRQFGFVLIPFLLVFAVLPFRFEYQPVRNMLPLYGIACVLAGFALARVAQMQRVFGVLSTLLVGLYVWQFGMQSYQMSLKRRVMVDSRIEALNWLKENRNDGEPIFLSSWLTFLPSEIARLSPPVHVSPEPDLVHGILPVVDGLFVLGSQGVPKGTPELGEGVSFGRKATPEQAWYWRTNKQQIRIYRKSSKEK